MPPRAPKPSSARCPLALTWVQALASTHSARSLPPLPSLGSRPPCLQGHSNPPGAQRRVARSQARLPQATAQAPAQAPAQILLLLFSQHPGMRTKSRRVSMLYGVSRTFQNDASSHRPPSRSTHSLRLLSSALPQVPLISFGASRSTVSRSPVRPILLLSPQSSSRPFSPSLFSRVRLLASAFVRCTCLVRFVPLVPHIHT